MEVAVQDKSPTMLIWLGKQRLGQRDNVDVSVQRYVQNLSDEELIKVASKTLGVQVGTIADKGSSVH